MINSSLLNDDDFKSLKYSIENISKIDGKEDFRVQLIEYINDTADNNDDVFFFDMLPFVAFLNPNDEAIAYTTPNKTIFLNSPGRVGENPRVWDFIYCHECLHQLWDTFGVGAEIEKNGVEYNHNILNIASDCVINDYLAYYRKKTMFEDGISPEYLKEKFNVDYDRKTDTQYSLYLKLIEKSKEIEKDPVCQKNFEGHIKPKSIKQGPNINGGGGGGEPEKHSPDYIKGWTDAIQDVLDKKVDPTDSDYKPKQTDNNEYDAGYNDCMGKIKKGLEEGVTLSKSSGSGKGGDLPEIPWEQPNDNSDGQGNSGDKGGKSDKQNNDNDNSSSESDADGKSNDDSEEDAGSKDGENGDKNSSNPEAELLDLTPEELRNRKLKANDIIEKYKDKISGAFGEFVKKCKVSKQLKSGGLSIRGISNKPAWNAQLNTSIQVFIKKIVNKKRQEYEETYSRVKRGSGFVEFGKPIKPGRRVKQNGIPINTSFYLDISSSMSGCINNVFSACFSIAEGIKKRFKGEKLIESLMFSSHVFNDDAKEITFGSRCNVDGGTMPFHKLLKYINSHKEHTLINIIITDAEFEVNKSEIKRFLDETAGIVIFITNHDNPNVKHIADETKYRTKLVYILADSNFNI